MKEIILDDCNGQYQLLGETVGLSGYSYKDYVNLKKEKTNDLNIRLDKKTELEDEELYKKGLVYANLQNVSRLLSETPANLSTPTRIAEFSQGNENDFY